MKRIWMFTIFAVAVTAAFLATSCDELITEVNEITISGYPRASFIVEVDSCCLPCTIQFFDDSDGPHQEWSWNFGDGSTAIIQDPLHSYAQAGKYTIILTITDTVDNNDDRQIRFNYINVKDTLPSSRGGFTINPTRGADTITFAFNDTTFGDIKSWSWDFGDSSAAGLTQSVNHTYSTPGTYEIRLTIENDCDSLDYIDTLIVTN